MAETGAIDHTEQTATASSEEKAQWPLSFQLKKPPPPSGPPRSVQYWSHALYRGPGGEPVQVFYSTTKQQSEELAQKFLHEPVLGFDGEWCSWYPHSTSDLKDVYSLVQLASEDKIGLFHIARHEGDRIEDLIAPSLRKIIESPDIIKTGVSIHNADFSRLRQYFKLNTQGGFELSELHNLVIGHPSTRLVALAKQVEYHLGLPLAKGTVRRSNWTKPLDAHQKFYAAADAYAGFMLYHCMNAKNAALSLPHPVSSGAHEGGKVSPSKRHLEESRKPQKESASFDPSAQELFQLLKSSRFKRALAEGVPPYCVAPNSVLEALSQARPTNNAGLAQIPGIGRERLRQYGAEWLSIISQFLAKNAARSAQEARGPLFNKTASDLNSVGPQPAESSPRGHEEAASASGKGACAPPPVIHTGLSFQMEATTLLPDHEPPNAGDTDDSSAFGSPLASPRKRRRSETNLPSERSEQGPGPNISKAVLSDTDSNQHDAENTQGIDYFSDQDEALWAEAFENFDTGESVRLITK